MPAALVSSPIPAPFWGVVRSLPRREAFAAERLEAGGFEVFLPLIQTKRASAPLFSSYFFIRIVEQWRAINSTLGVLCLVRIGDCPARCPDSEIDDLKAMIVGGFVRLPEAPAAPARCKIAIGAKVKITAGPFGGLSGLYAGQTSHDRERILLTMLGGQRPVLVAANLVAPCDACGNEPAVADALRGQGALHRQTGPGGGQGAPTARCLSRSPWGDLD